MGDGPQARRNRNKGTMKEDKELHEGSVSQGDYSKYTQLWPWISVLGFGNKWGSCLPGRQITLKKAELH